MSKASGALVASVLALAVWAWGFYTSFKSGGNFGDGLIGRGAMAVLTFNVTMLALMGFAIWLAPHSGGSTNTTTDRHAAWPIA